MAFSGLPEPTERCPKCGETLQYNAATRSYLHVLGICRRKYWERAELSELARGLDECDETQLGVLSALRRALDEIEDLRMQVTDLWGERR